MQIYLFGPSRARAISAILRNCLTYERAPQHCPVRKCRRDGCCSGPLASVRAADVPLADGPGDTGGDGMAVPVCWPTLTAGEAANVRIALGANIRALDRHLDSTVIETTRTIFARRWKRLRSAGRGATARRIAQGRALS